MSRPMKTTSGRRLQLDEPERPVEALGAQVGRRDAQVHPAGSLGAQQVQQRLDEQPAVPLALTARQQVDVQVRRVARDHRLGGAAAGGARGGRAAGPATSSSVPPSGSLIRGCSDGHHRSAHSCSKARLSSTPSTYPATPSSSSSTSACCGSRARYGPAQTWPSRSGSTYRPVASSPSAPVRRQTLYTAAVSSGRAGRIVAVTAAAPRLGRAGHRRHRAAGARRRRPPGVRPPRRR